MGGFAIWNQVSGDRSQVVDMRCDARPHRRDEVVLDELRQPGHLLVLPLHQLDVLQGKVVKQAPCIFQKKLFLYAFRLAF